MSLPKIEHPLFTVEIPSTKKKIKMRPMLVKEEKILLMAKESKDNNAIMLGVKQVINNCLADADIDVNNLTLFDIDYLFIKLRANSIDPQITLSFNDDDDDFLTNKDGKEILINGQPQKPVYTQQIDLNSVEVTFPKKQDQIIKIGKDSGIKLRYPPASTYESKKVASATTVEEILEELIIASFETYFEGDKVSHFKDSTHEEIVEFIDNLGVPTYNKVVEFFENSPTISYEFKYTNRKGQEKTITLNKLADFFIF